MHVILARTTDQARPPLWSSGLRSPDPGASSLEKGLNTDQCRPQCLNCRTWGPLKESKPPTLCGWSHSLLRLKIQPHNPVYASVLSGTLWLNSVYAADTRSYLLISSSGDEFL